MTTRTAELAAAFDRRMARKPPALGHTRAAEYWAQWVINSVLKELRRGE